MILVITAHDEPTTDNLTVAGGLAAIATTALIAHEAVRHNVVNALEGSVDMPLLVFSHGKPDHRVGHDNIPNLTSGDTDLLLERSTFAYACNTAGHLGPSVSNAGGTWFGFAGPLNALPADLEVRDQFEDITHFIAANFPSCTTPAMATAFIDNLSAVADEIFERLDEMQSTTFEHFHALRDITRRLRIFFPGEEMPIKHSDAVGDPIL